MCMKHMLLLSICFEAFHHSQSVCSTKFAQSLVHLSHIEYASLQGHVNFIKTKISSENAMSKMILNTVTSIGENFNQALTNKLESSLTITDNIESRLQATTGENCLRGHDDHIRDVGFKAQDTFKTCTSQIFENIDTVRTFLENIQKEIENAEWDVRRVLPDCKPNSGFSSMKGNEEDHCFNPVKNLKIRLDLSKCMMRDKTVTDYIGVIAHCADKAAQNGLEYANYIMNFLSKCIEASPDERAREVARLIPSISIRSENLVVAEYRTAQYWLSKNVDPSTNNFINKLTYGLRSFAYIKALVDNFDPFIVKNFLGNYLSNFTTALVMTEILNSNNMKVRQCISKGKSDLTQVFIHKTNDLIKCAGNLKKRADKIHVSIINIRNQHKMAKENKGLNAAIECLGDPTILFQTKSVSECTETANDDYKTFITDEIVKLQGYSEELNQLLCRIETCIVDHLHKAIKECKSIMEKTQNCLKKEASIQHILNNVIYKEPSVIDLPT